MNKSERNSARAGTSDENPIGVSWVEVPFTGRLGMTFAPGKHQTSKSGARHERSLAADLDRLVAVIGVDVLVCLLQDRELVSLQIPDLVAAAQERGIEVLRLPIPDAGVLPSLEPVRDLVRVIRDRLTDGLTVVVHCAGGLGRTGTIVGCFLTEQGHTAEQAMVMLKTARGPNCPETDGQRAFIQSCARSPSANAKTREPAGSSVVGTAREELFCRTVLGAAIGDAMGHPTEFLSMAEIHSKFGPEGVSGFELFWERGGARFAPYTDDTQMAEIVLRTLSLAVKRGLDLDATMKLLADAFVLWSRSPQGGHRAPGNACMSGARQLAAGVRWHEAGGESAGGCGSVMRSYPFGLLFADDLDRAEAWAVAHSKLTHRDPIALAACAAMAVGVAQAANGCEPRVICDGMIAAAERHSRPTASMMRDAVADAVNRTPPDVTLDRLRGFAAHEAISAALYVFARHPNDVRGAILEGANTPGDSDSIATLAGALVGAHPKTAALPSDWVRDVERSSALASLARASAGARVVSR